MTDRTFIRLLLVEDNPGDARLVREHLADATGAQTFRMVDNAPTLGRCHRAVQTGANRRTSCCST